jgi:E3 ubiquitin-protein ligase UBR2
LTDVPGPQGLEHFAPNEHEELSKYLGLPQNPQELFSIIRERGLARQWASHPAVLATLAVASSDVRTLNYPLKLNSLINLPHDYTELINNVSTFTCPNYLSDESRVPAMCLTCGEIMCSQSYCCQTTIEGHSSPVGACTAHTEVCGGGVGIFLRVRECKVVLLAGPSKGCFIQPPYVDQYGETDAGLRRGNPLHLCPDKYRKIYKLWLNHSVPQEISHSLETNQYMINTPWFHL